MVLAWREWNTSLVKNWKQVALEDPKRFRVEMTFSRGADLSPLEVNMVLLTLAG